MNRMWRIMISVAVIAVAAAALVGYYSLHRGIIPPNELAEIKREAFNYATQYIISDAELNARYEEEVARQQARDKRLGRAYSLYPGRDKVPAIAQIRGVQLIPISRVRCQIKFDFVPSRNPHAELPWSEAIAERFETEKGYYWVIHR